ncbi:MAG: tRNA (adenosine(37)-N6)-threonylcarbamoyltransferase complex dimerization subunit type 1 TsaB [Terriglobales bacterium]
MLLLAVDTSGKNGSLALARATPGQRASDISVLEVVPLAGGAFSAQLAPQIAALLEKHGHSKGDLEAFAVASGPGSFTGLRVGLAAIKALAEALGKPIVAISLLEAVARSGAACGRVLAALDAGRGEVYAGDYELDPQVHMHSERLLSREEFVAEAGRSEGEFTAVVTPDAALAEAIRAAGIRVERIICPDAGAIARLGWEHLQRGATVLPEALEANYIRRSDAEIFSKPAP